MDPVIFMDHVLFMDYTPKNNLEEFLFSVNDLFSDVISMRSWTLISASIQKTSLHRSTLTNNRCLLATRSMKIDLPPVCTATKQRMIPFTRHARATTKASSRACLAGLRATRPREEPATRNIRARAEHYEEPVQIRPEPTSDYEAFELFLELEGHSFKSSVNGRSLYVYDSSDGLWNLNGGHYILALCRKHSG